MIKKERTDALIKNQLYHEELKEAVYLFHVIYPALNQPEESLCFKETFRHLNISREVYEAIMKILVINKLITYDQNTYRINEKHLSRHSSILKLIDHAHKNTCENMREKINHKGHFFFNALNPLEYEIYSRVNYQVTHATGLKVLENLSFSNETFLEIGGNSGGFGAAVLTKHKDCQYTVVDKEVPCIIGKGLNEGHLNLSFIQGDAFNLNLQEESYTYIVLMNFLHDFNDKDCKRILKECYKYCHTETKFIIIEDILKSRFKPSEMIMQGLRLSVECSGGRQRTVSQMEDLFLDLGYQSQFDFLINPSQRMMIMDKTNNEAESQ